jgi:hypothetical protein
MSVVVLLSYSLNILPCSSLPTPLLLTSECPCRNRTDGGQSRPRPSTPLQRQGQTRVVTDATRALTGAALAPRSFTPG